MGHSSSPKSPSEPPAQAELLIPVLRAGEEPAQRSQANGETESQTRTDSNRAQDGNSAARLCWKQEVSGGFRHREPGRFPGGEESGPNLGERRSRMNGGAVLSQKWSLSWRINQGTATRDAKTSVKMEGTPGVYWGAGRKPLIADWGEK